MKQIKFENVMAMIFFFLAGSSFMFNNYIGKIWTGLIITILLFFGLIYLYEGGED